MFVRMGMLALLTFGFINVPSYGKSKLSQGEDQGATLRFKLREEYKVIIPVSVNGLEPASFILDTGTKTSIVDERICRKLNLRMIARMPLTTFTGTTVVTISPIESLSMGVASAAGLEVVCADLPKIYPLDSEIRGVLGQDFLSRFNYLLDYREHKIILEEDGDLRQKLAGAECPVQLKEHRDYILYDSSPEARNAIRFMLDSGAPYPMIFENPQVNAALQIEREIPTMYSPGSVAGRSIDTGRIRTFQIGSETIRNLSVRLTRARENENRWENGLLPTSLFRSIYFNHDKGYVILNPRLKDR